MALNLNVDQVCRSINTTSKDVSVIAEACEGKLKELKQWPHKAKPSQKGGRECINTRSIMNWVDSVKPGDDRKIISKLKQLHATASKRCFVCGSGEGEEGE